MRHHIAIIGAGLTGLSAAYHLLEREPNLRITIFESEARVGGRVLTHSKPFGEHGAQFFLAVSFMEKIIVVRLKRTNFPQPGH
jgi:protoporphyrinogen oxidase